MIPPIDNERPLWSTFQAAWSACLGLPRYDKAAWKALAARVVDAEATADPSASKDLLLAVEDLLVAQGGRYDGVHPS